MEKPVLRRGLTDQANSFSPNRVLHQILKYLRRHPFPVDAHFERAVALSFAFPAQLLGEVVSDGLEIDACDGFGFVTLAMVWTKGLRPAGTPRFLGQDFFLGGYRIFTRLNDGGRRLRGLQILRSETDRRRMAWMGNLFTHYHYRHAQVRITRADGSTRVVLCAAGRQPHVDVTFQLADDSAALPVGSPFRDWRRARQFAGPLPFTFSAESDRKFVVIEGVRQHWTPHPVTVKSWHIGLFDQPPFSGAKPILANAFAVHDVPYRWKQGRIVELGGDE